MDVWLERAKTIKKDLEKAFLDAAVFHFLTPLPLWL